jgi:hypothetical protein
VQKKESAPAEKPNAQPQIAVPRSDHAEPQPKRKQSDPAVPAQPRKKPSLFHREDKPGDPTSPPPPPGGAAADRPRKNIFQRILGSLNPTRLFHRAA